MFLFIMWVWKRLVLVGVEGDWRRVVGIMVEFLDGYFSVVNKGWDWGFDCWVWRKIVKESVMFWFLWKMWRVFVGYWIVN